MARLELNLLVALDALLTERSVTRAAARLQLSQPALSASLARLRIYFDDPLLRREGNAYRLTPLAARLAEQTAVALEAARKVFANEAVFDPAQSHREFTIYGSDYAFTELGSRISAIAHDRAPNVRFRFMHHTPAVVADAAFALRTADAMLLPHGYVVDLPCINLYEDDWVCLVATDNPRVGDRLTMQDFTELPWVFTYQGRNAFTPAGQQLQLMGIEPRIEAVVEGFLTLPAFIAGTDRIGMVQRRLAARVVAYGDVRALEPPFEVLPLVGALWWHPVHDRDPAHEWMRSLFAEVGASVFGPPGTLAGVEL